MEIPKAIELLQMDINDPGSVAIEDVNEAEQLGIEALKRFEEQRKDPECRGFYTLPGETEPEPTTPTLDQIKRLRESPLGGK